jgi:hypothetical protein
VYSTMMDDTSGVVKCGDKHSTMYILHWCSVRISFAECPTLGCSGGQGTTPGAPRSVAIWANKAKQMMRSELRINEGTAMTVKGLNGN